MRQTFRNQLQRLREHVNRFDSPSAAIRKTCMAFLVRCDLPLDEYLTDYHDALLFIHAHPSGRTEYSLAGKELQRISRFLKQHRLKTPKKLLNSGLPYTDTVTRYSHDGLRWILSHPGCTVTPESFEDPAHHLNDVLRLTLPPLERSETTAGLNNEELMDTLLVSRKQRLTFIVDELARFDSLPFVKDHLFDRLDLFVRVRPKRAGFSRTYNRLPGFQPVWQKDWIKRPDAAAILQQPLPEAARHNSDSNSEIIRVIKDAMAVTARETDPATFMMPSSLRLYHLERGISVALYDMIPERQLPLESYVGFTAFKNGYPVAYGGAWIFGHRAQFGINIFEAFRGGESACLMAQILRTYRQRFDLHCFEIEPYQFGLDNPEGIASGAFWFYYRMGFRPVDQHLRQAASQEAKKIADKKGYRSPEAFLLRMTESNMSLQMEEPVPPRLSDIMTRVTNMIRRDFGGRRLQAESTCRTALLSVLSPHPQWNAHEDQVLRDIALWVAASNLPAKEHASLLLGMVREKPSDVYAYQAVLRKFLDLLTNRKNH